jgi:hypothetical protein
LEQRKERKIFSYINILFFSFNFFSFSEKFFQQIFQKS